MSILKTGELKKRPGSSAKPAGAIGGVKLSAESGRMEADGEKPGAGRALKEESPAESTVENE